MEENINTEFEASRLIDWLVAHGHSYEEACNCIKYIAGEN